MIKKIIDSFFTISLILIFGLLMSFIPIDFVSKNIIKQLANKNITCAIRNAWHFKLINLSITNKDVFLSRSYNQNSFVKAKIEKIEKSLVTDNVYIENGVIQIYLPSNVTYSEFLNIVSSLEANSQYNLRMSNTIFQILVQKNDKKDEYDLVKEMFFANLYISNQRNVFKILMQLATSTAKTMNIEYRKLIGGTGGDKVNDLLLLKIKSEDNINCKFVIEKELNGSISCNIKNIANILNEIGYKVTNPVIKQISNRDLKLNLNIEQHKSQILAIGSINLNGNVGNIKFSKLNDNQKLTIDFDRINLDAVGDSEYDLDKLKIKTRLDINDNPWLDNLLTSKINPVSGIENLVNFALNAVNNNSAMNVKFQAKAIEINKRTISNVQLDFDKLLDTIVVNSGYASINNNILQINNIGNDNKTQLWLYGNEFDAIADILGLGSIMNQKLRKKKYTISGVIINDHNMVALENLLTIIDSQPIMLLDYRMSVLTSRLNNKFIRQLSLTFNEISITDIIDKSLIYEGISRMSSINNSSAKDPDKDSDAQKKDNNYLIQRLLNDRNKGNIIDVYNVTFINCKFLDLLVNNVSLSFSQASDYMFNSSLTLDTNVISGNIDLSSVSLNNTDLTIKNNISLYNVDFTAVPMLSSEFFQRTHKSFFDIIIQNRNYNVPSFVGINLDAAMVIKNIKLSKDISLSDISATAGMHNGLLAITDFIINYNNGKIAANINVSLQAMPKFDIAFSTSGLPLKNILGTNKIDGYLTSQGRVYLSGFNPVTAIQEASGNVVGSVDNIVINNYGLYDLSYKLYAKKPISIDTYYGIVNSNSLVFPTSNLKINLNNKKATIAFNADRELVSMQSQMEFDIAFKTLTKSANNLIILGRGANDQSFPIYVATNCNGRYNQYQCITNWDSVEEYIKVINAK